MSLVYCENEIQVLRWPWNVMLPLELFVCLLISFVLAFLQKCFSFPLNIFAFLQINLLSLIYLCFCSPAKNLTSLQVFLLSYTYFYFPANIFAFLQLIVFFFKCFYFLQSSCFPSNIFAFFIYFTFPQSFKFPSSNKY